VVADGNCWEQACGTATVNEKHQLALQRKLTMVGQQVGVVLPAERYHHSLDVVLHQWCCSCFVNTSLSDA